jgi:MtN3 and saliva related transmembrane protein
MILGFTGLVLILVGWIPQTIDTIKAKKCNLNVRFTLIYLFGSLFLTAYSLQLGDMVFTILNAGAALVALINLMYSDFSKLF